MPIYVSNPTCQTGTLNNFFDESLGSIVVIHIVSTLFEMSERAVQKCNISISGNFKYLFRPLTSKSLSVLLTEEKNISYTVVWKT